MAGCPLCGCGARRLYARAPDHVTGEMFDVLRCPECTLAVTDPQPRDLDRFYPRLYRQFSPVVFRIVRFCYRLRVRSWIHAFGKAGRALEIGCGNGWMLAALVEHGWQVVGTERALAPAAQVKSRLDVPVYVGGLDAIREGARFDLVVLFQVLEHLTDPLGTLAECARRLKPGGNLVVAVPNLESWQARIFGALWLHLDVPRHLFHFSPNSLTRTLAQVGLCANRISFASWEHDPIGWLQSVLNHMGFSQNLLVRWLQGQNRESILSPTGIALIAAALMLAVPSVLLAVLSWAMGRGALMEVRAVKPVNTVNASGPRNV